MMAVAVDGPTTTSAPALSPTTKPASPEISALLVDLRSKKFKTREQAQSKLIRARDEVLVYVIPLLNDADAEVASRAATIVGKPADPALRVEAAIRLLTTADPDLMERAVHMLYENPLSVGDLFIARTKDDQGMQRVVTEPVALHLKASVVRLRNFQKHYEKLVQEKPEAAEKQKQMSEETNGYEAEAAFWTVYEGLLEHRRQLSGTGTDPVAPTTQPEQ
mgnify:CR=1 FL=1